MTREGARQSRFSKISHDGEGGVLMRKDKKVLTVSEEQANKLARSTLYNEIKNDLLGQLKSNGTSGKYYTDLIDDYMDMWVTKTLLVLDIKTRGVTVKYDNGGGQSGVKRNDSIADRIKVNAQMLKLLADLGIKPSQQIKDDDDDL